MGLIIGSRGIWDTDTKDKNPERRKGWWRSRALREKDNVSLYVRCFMLTQQGCFSFPSSSNPFVGPFSPYGRPVAELENTRPGCLPLPQQRKTIFLGVHMWWKIAVLQRKKFYCPVHLPTCGSAPVADKQNEISHREQACNIWGFAYLGLRSSLQNTNEWHIQRRLLDWEITPASCCVLFSFQ